MKRRRRPWLVGTVSVVALLLSAPSAVRAQEEASKDRLYLEGLGNGIIWSLSYERTLWKDLSVRIGGGGTPFTDLEYALGYAMADWRFGGRQHGIHVAVGAGVVRIVDVPLLETTEETVAYGTASLAYEFRPRPRGFFLRLAFTPVFTTDEGGPWGGGGFGFAF
jgi:hypothetical protein